MENGMSFTLPKNPPLFFYAFILLIILTVVALQPSILIKMGIFTESILSKNDLVRKTTLLEIKILRLIASIIAASLLLIMGMWKKIIGYRLIKKIFEGEPVFISHSWYNKVLNHSFFVSLVLVVISFVYILIAKKVFSQEVINLIDSEKGVVEIGSFVINFVSFLLTLYLFVKEKTVPKKHFLLIVSVVCFLFAGEEISWGQNFIHWETPAQISKINVQNETNFHNMLGYFADHIYTLGIITYCILLPFLWRKSPGWNVFINRFGIILPSLGLNVGFLLIFILQKRLIWDLFPSSYRMRIDEIREFLCAIGMLMIFIEYYFIQKRTKNRVTK